MTTTEKRSDPSALAIDPDHRISEIEPDLHCKKHGDRLELETKPEIQPKGQSYSYRCPHEGCEVALELIVPKGASQRRDTEKHHSKGETELHPDDGVKLAEVEFFSSPPRTRLVRRAKKVQTVYEFGRPGEEPELYVVVDHEKKPTIWPTIRSTISRRR